MRYGALIPGQSSRSAAMSAEQLTDHVRIRHWAEERGAKPARVKSTAGKGSGGFLRLSFGQQDDELEEISWDEFFAIFERSHLALLTHDAAPAGKSVAKLISRRARR
jgi:hypothetical protein